MRQQLARDILDQGHGYFAPAGAEVTAYSPTWYGAAGEAEFFIAVETNQTWVLRQGGGSYINTTDKIVLKVGLGDVIPLRDGS